MRHGKPIDRRFSGSHLTPALALNCSRHHELTAFGVNDALFCILSFSSFCKRVWRPAARPLSKLFSLSRLSWILISRWGSVSICNGRIKSDRPLSLETFSALSSRRVLFWCWMFLIGRRWIWLHALSSKLQRHPKSKFIILGIGMT